MPFHSPVLQHSIYQIKWLESEVSIKSINITELWCFVRLGRDWDLYLFGGCYWEHEFQQTQKTKHLFLVFVLLLLRIQTTNTNDSNEEGKTRSHFIFGDTFTFFF